MESVSKSFLQAFGQLTQLSWVRLRFEQLADKHRKRMSVWNSNYEFNAQKSTGLEIWGFMAIYSAFEDFSAFLFLGSNPIRRCRAQWMFKRQALRPERVEAIRLTGQIRLYDRCGSSSSWLQDKIKSLDSRAYRVIKLNQHELANCSINYDWFHHPTNFCSIRSFSLGSTIFVHWFRSVRTQQQ